MYKYNQIGPYIATKGPKGRAQAQKLAHAFGGCMGAPIFGPGPGPLGPLWPCMDQLYCIYTSCIRNVLISSVYVSIISIYMAIYHSRNQPNKKYPHAPPEIFSNLVHPVNVLIQHFIKC